MTNEVDTMSSIKQLNPHGSRAVLGKLLTLAPGSGTTASNWDFGISLAIGFAVFEEKTN